MYSRFCCGATYKDNNLFSRYPNSIQLQIYNDDFELCNPLGSKATLYKMCAVYFTILNIPSRYRSRLVNTDTSINLVCLVNTDDLKTEYTDFNDVWRLIVHEVKQLESGIEINGSKMYGTIATLSYDNLGANMSLGFVESFNATHSCRFCVIDKELLKKIAIEC